MKAKKPHYNPINQHKQLMNITKSVFQIFAQIQLSPSLNKSHIFQLIQIFNHQPLLFTQAFQQAYLKIFKCFHEKANKKIPSKFQSLAEMFFKQILKQKQINQQTKNCLNNFINLLTEAIYSTIMNVKVMASRIIFIILKSLPNIDNNNNTITYYLSQSSQKEIPKSVHFLIKQKVSTYRQLGIKLCSLALIIPSQHKAAIEAQLFKILATEQNQHIRKMVITNIPLSQNNMDSVLLRLRDKNPQIRATLLRRLLSDKFRLDKMKLNNRYKLLYDGYGTKDIISKQQALRYFVAYFKQSNNNNSQSLIMQEQNKFSRFIQLFQPNILLVNSHLYLLFNKLIGQLLTLLPQLQTCEYIRKLCLKVKSSLKDKGSRRKQFSNELIWLKNASIIRPQLKQVNNTFEQYGPSGMQLSNILTIFFEEKNIFAINEFLQLFSNMNMPDQIGRNKMFDTLKQSLLKLSYYQIQLDLKQIPKKDDICNTQTIQQIKQKKFMLSYYDIPIISDSTDLINPIINAMKTLRPQTYIREFQQTISEWSDPQNNILLKQKMTTQLNIKRLTSSQQQLKNSKNINLLKTLTQKLNKIQKQIHVQNYKTITCISVLSRVKYDWNIDPYMGIIKNELAKNDKSNGLLLLGLYCLQNAEKVCLFLPLFWYHIMKQTTSTQTQSILSITEQKNLNKLHLLISLKIMTDFIVKFNILNSPSIMNNTTTQQSTQHNPDTFMQRITQLILNKDPDIKIFAIECLCRIIYHNRVDQNNISTYFLYLLLLWWETSIEEVSAKSVHTISLFFRSYLEKGNQQVTKLAEMLCIFHKILKIFEQKNKTINKSLIVYNLKMNEFIKKTVGIATTVLKYHKEKKTIYTYQQGQLGPQQFFLLYLLYEPGFQNILQRPLNICDFYQKCPLQTLIFVKKKIQQFQNLIQNEEFFGVNYKHDKIVTKKSLEQLLRFQRQLQSYISVKDKQTFDQNLINHLEKVFLQSSSYINQQAKRIAKNIQEQEIFISVDSDIQSDQEENQEENQEDNQNQQDHQENNDIQLSSHNINNSQHNSNQNNFQDSNSNNTQSLKGKQSNDKINTVPTSRKNTHKIAKYNTYTKLNNQNNQNSLLKANKPNRPRPNTTHNKLKKLQLESQLQKIDSQKQSSQQLSQQNNQSQQNSNRKIKMKNNNNNNKNVRNIKRIPKLTNQNLRLKQELDNDDSSGRYQNGSAANNRKNTDKNKNKINEAPIRRTRASKLN